MSARINLEELEREDFEPEETAVAIDPALAKAVDRVADAVAARAYPEFPKFPKLPDYSDTLTMLAEGVIGLRIDINRLTKAVAEIKAADLGAIAKGLDRVAATNEAIASALKAPKHFTTDSKGEITGLETGRLN